MNLHTRLFRASMAIVAAITVAASFISYEYARRSIFEQNREKIGVLAEIIGNGLRTMMLEGRGKDFQRFLSNLVAEEIEAIRIFTENGTILTSSIPGETGKQVPERFLTVIQARPEAVLYSERPGGKAVYSQSVYIKNDLLCQKCHGTKESIRGVLDVEIAAADLDHKLAAALRRIVLWAAVMLAAAALFFSRMTNTFVRKPLDALFGRVRSASRESRGAGDDLQRIAAALDAMEAECARTRDELSRCALDRSRHNERLADIGELAAAVAHGIKNPLAGISGALQVLAEDFPADSPRKEIADEVLKEIGRLDTAVKDLLFFARPPELHLIPTDINAIIEKVRRVLGPEAERLQVKIVAASGSISEVMADPEQMERAVVSIAAHSMQSMEPGGCLTMTAAPYGNDGGVEISLCDTGRGIPEDKLGEVFKPFFSTKQSGTGLSLAIARNIVESHKGTVAVESREGRGTTFRIVLGKGSGG